jgi:hypothetical protein
MSSQKGTIIHLINPHSGSILPSGLPNVCGKMQSDEDMPIYLSDDALDYMVGDTNTPFTVLRATSLEEVQAYYRRHAPMIPDEIVDEVARIEWMTLQEIKNKLSNTMV